MGRTNWVRLLMLSTAAGSLAVAGYATPVSLGAASAPVPSAQVISVSAKPSAVPAAGGTVVVTARVRHATSCQIALVSSEHFPVTYSHDPKLCAGGVYVAKVTIGANPDKKRHSLALVLLAYNQSSSFTGSFYVAVAALSGTTGTKGRPPVKVGPTTTVPATTSSTTPTMVGNSPVVMPDSLFRQNVQAWPLDPNSAIYAADVVSDYTRYYGSVGVSTMPIYEATASTPGQRVSVAPGCANFLTDTGNKIPIPSFARLNGSPDNPLAVYQPSTGKEWELWRASPTSNGYQACWGGRLTLATADGVFPAPYGLSASGISYLATTITEADVESGSINHAIAVILPRCDAMPPHNGVYPANRGDCGQDANQPAEGQWFRFPADLPMPSGLAPFAQMVFTAIQDYGMVVIDHGGDVAIEAEQPSDWAAEGNAPVNAKGQDPITASRDGLLEYQVVADLPWASLQVVDPPQS